MMVINLGISSFRIVGKTALSAILFLILIKAHAQDSATTYRAIQDALQKRDTTKYQALAHDYLKLVSKPFLKNNVKVFVKLTTATKDKTFAFLIKNDRIVLDSGGVYLLEELKWKIHEEYIVKFKSEIKTEAEWQRFVGDMDKKFGEAGEEIAQRFHLLNLMERKEWVLFDNQIKSFLDKNATLIHPNDVNEFCWSIFLTHNDINLLDQAVQWMYKSMKDPLPEYIDTYANLLYKLGKKEEAIMWQEKVVAEKGKDSEFQTTLDQMKKGEPTWP